MTNSIQNNYSNLNYPTATENNNRTSKLAERLAITQQSEKNFFGCPCPQAWNHVSEYVLSIFFERPLTEEQHWAKFPSLSPLRSTIQNLCEEALEKYPALEGRTTLELFSNAFETAVKKGNYEFAKRLFQAHPEIKALRYAAFPFVVNGNLHPAFKALPEFCDRLIDIRGFLKEDLNHASLSLALREKPSAVKLLLINVTPTPAHMEEAITLQRIDAINLFLKKWEHPIALSDYNFVSSHPEMVDCLLSHGAHFTPLLAKKAVECENVKLIDTICSKNYDLWPYMLAQAKMTVYSHLLGMPIPQNCILYLLRNRPGLIVNFIEKINLNQALLELEDDQIVLQLLAKGLKPDAASLTLAIERGNSELIALIQGVENLQEKLNISAAEGCLIDEFPEFLPLLKGDRNLESLCVLARRKFPEVQFTNLSQFLTESFEAAINKNNYHFAKKLLASGAKFSVNVPFVVNGALNPVFKKIPQIFEYRALLESDLNSASLLVALREMPKIAPYIWQNGVDPSSPHLDEALLQENEEAIDFFRKRNVFPTADAVDAALQRNDVKGMKRLLDLGAKPPRITYDFYRDPLNRDMTVLLKVKGAQFSLDFARQAVENEDYPLIKRCPHSLFPKMVFHAQKEEMTAFLMRLIFPEINKEMESCCIRAIIRYPELATPGKTAFQFFADAFAQAVKNNDYSLAFQLLKTDAVFNISSRADFSILVNGEVNPAFITLMPELKKVPIDPVQPIREDKHFVTVDIKDLAEETYKGLLQRIEDFPCVLEVKAFELLQKRKSCSTEAIYQAAKEWGMNAVCRYLEGISPIGKRSVELKSDPNDEYYYMNRYGLIFLETIFKKHDSNIDWENAAKALCGSKEEFYALCEEELQRAPSNVRESFNNQCQGWRDACSKLYDQINQIHTDRIEMESQLDKKDKDIRSLKYDQERKTEWITNTTKRYASELDKHNSELKYLNGSILTQERRQEVENERANKQKEYQSTFPQTYAGSEQRNRRQIEQIESHHPKNTAERVSLMGLYGISPPDRHTELKLEITELNDILKDEERSKARIPYRVKKWNERWGQHDEDIETVKAENMDLENQIAQLQTQRSVLFDKYMEFDRRILDIPGLEDQASVYHNRLNNRHYPVNFMNVLWMSSGIKKTTVFFNYFGKINKKALEEVKKKLEKGDFESSNFGGITFKEIWHLAAFYKKFKPGLRENEIIDFACLECKSKSFFDFLRYYWQADHLGARLNLAQFCEEIAAILKKKGVCRIEGVPEAFLKAYDEIRVCYS